MPATRFNPNAPQARFDRLGLELIEIQSRFGSETWRFRNQREMELAANALGQRFQ
jgi:hypothetical protein